MGRALLARPPKRVDVPGPASTATDTLVDQAILAVFQQHPTKAQAVLNRQPNLSTQLLTEVRPTDVVMTLSEPAEFEAERLLYEWTPLALV